MSERVRIVDIAEELGVSTATVSNVIHGKTKKISDETVKRVQELLEKRQYIPSMAGILLAQNDSKIVGVVVNNHEKYEGHVLEDGFISSSLNYLSAELEKAGYFMMVKVTKEWNEISRFASMWNMEGIIVIGFCEQDYQKLKETTHIPFIVYDGYFEQNESFANITIDNYSGGFQMGSYLKSMGHKNLLCISDNNMCMDMERYKGFCDALKEEKTEFLLIPMEKEERKKFYKENLEKIKQYTAVFAVSDYYALDLINFLQAEQIKVPEEISVAGFDDSPLCGQVYPKITTIKQDGKLRAQTALKMLTELKNGVMEGKNIIQPVLLVERESVIRR
ncbi:MAG: LacI family DNA-binding transcriptional regulator [Lachnospiraceae bacterium]|nr:LacI family DNA-binding transcriptional regulator [Lachnospiraceae bacterium]